MVYVGGLAPTTVERYMSDAIVRKSLAPEKALPFKGVPSPQKGCWSGHVQKMDKSAVNMELEYTGRPQDLAGHIRTYGPTMVHVKAGPEMFLYTTGVAREQSNRNQDFAGYHSVEVVGVSQDFFVIKNSWGPRWGENGYMRIEREHFLRNYLVSHDSFDRKFMVHSVGSTVDQVMNRVNQRYRHLALEENIEGKKLLQNILGERFARFSPSSQRFKNPNECKLLVLVETVAVIVVIIE